MLYFSGGLIERARGSSGDDRIIHVRSHIHHCGLLPKCICVKCICVPYVTWFLLVAIPFSFSYVLDMQLRAQFVHVDRSERRLVRIAHHTQLMEQTLLVAFPPTAMRQLGQTRQGTRHPNTVLVVTDGCGFTAWTTRTSPLDVIHTLSRMFRELDAAAVSWGVEKVCTVGDSYVGAVFGPCQQDDDGDNDNDQTAPHEWWRDEMVLPNQEHEQVHEPSVEPDDVVGRRVLCGVQFGLDAMRLPHQINLPIRNRVGVHVGTVYAGFVGFSPPVFDVFGAAVTEAKALEGSGAPSRVHVSRVAMALCESCGCGRPVDVTPTANGVLIASWQAGGDLTISRDERSYNRTPTEGELAQQHHMSERLLLSRSPKQSLTTIATITGTGTVTTTTTTTTSSSSDGKDENILQAPPVQFKDVAQEDLEHGGEDDDDDDDDGHHEPTPSYEKIKAILSFLRKSEPTEDGGGADVHVKDEDDTAASLHPTHGLEQNPFSRQFRSDTYEQRFYEFLAADPSLQKLFVVLCSVSVIAMCGQIAVFGCTSSDPDPSRVLISAVLYAVVVLEIVTSEIKRRKSSPAMSSVVLMFGTQLLLFISSQLSYASPPTAIMSTATLTRSFLSLRSVQHFKALFRCFSSPRRGPLD
eukprot:PhM_4_TR9517/c2_g3_i17/m.98315